jgi:hypothetical protein
LPPERSQPSGDPPELGRKVNPHTSPSTTTTVSHLTQPLPDPVATFRQRRQPSTPLPMATSQVHITTITTPPRRAIQTTAALTAAPAPTPAPPPRLCLPRRQRPSLHRRPQQRAYRRQPCQSCNGMEAHRLSSRSGCQRWSGLASLMVPLMPPRLPLLLPRPSRSRTPIRPTPRTLRVPTDQIKRVDQPRGDLLGRRDRTEAGHDHRLRRDRPGCHAGLHAEHRSGGLFP